MLETNLINECMRCLSCAKPRCQAVCPVNNDIPSFLRLVKGGQYSQAVSLIGHPFGEICGYVCPHESQCQGGCVLSQRGQAVRVSDIEKAVFATNPFNVERSSDTLSNVKIAVVGGGVAGVTFAVATYMAGADVVIYERNTLLSTLKSIPEFRLPREAIRRVEESINGKIDVVRKDISLDDLVELRRDFDVVYVACGCSKAYTLGVSGEEYAVSYNDCLSGKAFGNVLVVGGGNTAIDCARFAKRRGCNVTVVYRRAEKDMPAFCNEIANAKSDGVKFIFNSAPTRLEKRGNKLILSVAKTISNGRGKLELTDDITEMVCDEVVSAIGSKFDDSILGQAYNVGDNGQVFDNIYIGGDAKGGSLVAQAVSDALKTAKSIIEER